MSDSPAAEKKAAAEKDYSEATKEEVLQEFTQYKVKAKQWQNKIKERDQQMRTSLHNMTEQVREQEKALEEKSKTISKLEARVEELLHVETEMETLQAQVGQLVSSATEKVTTEYEHELEEQQHTVKKLRQTVSTLEEQLEDFQLRERGYGLLFQRKKGEEKEELGGDDGDRIVGSIAKKTGDWILIEGGAPQQQQHQHQHWFRIDHVLQEARTSIGPHTADLLQSIVADCTSLEAYHEKDKQLHIGQMEEQVAEAQQRVDDAAKKVHAAEEAKDELQKEKSSLEGELTQLREELRAAHRKFEEEKNALSENSQLAEAKMSQELDAQKKKFQEEYKKSFETQLKQLQSESKELREYNMKAQQVMKSMKAHDEEEETQHVALENQLKESQQECERLAAALDSSVKERDALSSRCAQHEKEMVALKATQQQQLAAHQEETQQCREQHSKLAAELEAKSDALVHAAQEIQELKKKAVSDSSAAGTTTAVRHHAPAAVLHSPQKHGGSGGSMGTNLTPGATATKAHSGEEGGAKHPSSEEKKYQENVVSSIENEDGNERSASTGLSSFGRKNSKTLKSKASTSSLNAVVEDSVVLDFDSILTSEDHADHLGLTSATSSRGGITSEYYLRLHQKLQTELHRKDQQIEELRDEIRDLAANEAHHVEQEKFLKEQLREIDRKKAREEKILSLGGGGGAVKPPASKRVRVRLCSTNSDQKWNKDRSEGRSRTN